MKKTRNPTFKIALRGILRRKGQSAIVIIGILFAVMFITMTGIIGNSVILTTDKNLKDNYGEQNLLISNYPPLNKEDSRSAKYAQTILEHPVVSDLEVMEISGFLGDKENQSKKYYVGSVTEQAANMAHINVLEGRLPNESGEFALEKSMLKILGIDAQIGDEISLDMQLKREDLEENPDLFAWMDKYGSENWISISEEGIKTDIEGALIFKRDAEKKYGNTVNYTALNELIEVLNSTLTVPVPLDYTWVCDTQEQWLEKSEELIGVLLLELADPETQSLYTTQTVTGTLVGIVDDYTEMQMRSEGAVSTKRISIFIDQKTATKYWQSHTMLVKYNPLASDEELEDFDDFLRIMLRGANGEYPEYKPQAYLNNMVYNEDFTPVGNSDNGDSFRIILGLMLIIMLGALLLIVNAFLISLKQRLRSIGFLRAIGAGKYQIRRIVFWEAAIYALITIIPGILLGVGVSCGVLEAVSYYTQNEMVFGFEWFIICLAAITGALSIVIGSIIPAHRASKVAPISAAAGMQNEQKRGKKSQKGKSKTMSPLTLARRSMSQNKMRVVTSVLALVMSVSVLNVVLTYINYTYDTSPLFLEEKSISISKLNPHLIESNQLSGISYRPLTEDPITGEMIDSYISYNDDGTLVGIPAESVKKIEAIDGVEKVEYNRLTEHGYIIADIDNLSSYERNLFLKQREPSGTMYGLLDGLRVTETDIPNFAWEYTPQLSESVSKMSPLYGAVAEMLEGKLMPNSGYSSQNKAAIQIDLLSMNESDLKKLSQYVVDGNIDISKILSGEEVIISTNSLVLFPREDNIAPYFGFVGSDYTGDDEISASFKAGDTLEIVMVSESSHANRDIVKVLDSLIPEDSDCQLLQRSNAKKVKIGAVIDGYFADNTIITSNSFITDDLAVSNFEPSTMNIYLDMDISVAQAEKVISSIMDIRYQEMPDTHYENTYNLALKVKKQLNSIQMYFSLISAAIMLIGFFALFNTMTSRVNGSKYEINLMRAVGMTNRQVRKMFIFEGGLYGIVAAAIALLLSGLSAAMMLQEDFLKYIPWDGIAISVIVCVLIGIFAIILPTRKIFKGNIIEGISHVE